MASASDPSQQDKTRRRFWDNPFLASRATVPAYRIRIRQKRALWLVGIALALAGLGALLGANLLQKPRQVRTTVKADLRLLDARLWDTVSCLAGPTAHRDGSDLAPRIVNHSLRLADWPERVARCRRMSALLLSTTSAIIASASAAPGRLTEDIRKEYRKVLQAASALHLAVSAVADEALAGYRIPAWPRCVAVGRAVGQFQARLSRVEHFATIHDPRAAPAHKEPSPPRWVEPARLTRRISVPGAARFSTLARPSAEALLLEDLDAARPPSLLLLDPLGQAHLAALPAPLAPATPDLLWLDLVTPASSAFTPGLFWAQAGFDQRSAMGTIQTGTSGSQRIQARISWPRVRGVAARPVAGLARGSARQLVVSAPHGLAVKLALFRSSDEGRTFGPPLLLAEDASSTGPHTLLDSQPEGTPLLAYSLASGGTALQLLPQGAGAPPPRVLLDTGLRPRAPTICWADPKTLFVAGAGGRLWVSRDGGGSFRTVRQPQNAKLNGLTRLACLKSRVAVTKRRTSSSFDYFTCGFDDCSPLVRLSWSRLHDVRLTATSTAVQILAAGPRILFSRRDKAAAGKPAAPRALTRWKTPPVSWHVIRGPNPDHIAVLLLNGTVSRLRTTNGGVRWAGE
ncbi:MAG: hypothetical protein ABI333_21925 [bacterium]